MREASTSRSSDRLVNRLSSNRGLPKFNDDGLDWLKFKHAFDISTELGGYSDREKIARLYDCLEGKARDAVASLMMTASNTAQIMQSLELRFGNKDVILRKIVQGVKRLPKINTGQVDIATVATEVNNAVAAMEAMNHVGYLHSPELAQEIIEKIPSAMVYQYNRHLNEVVDAEDPRLKTIARFLHHEAELACKAGTVRPKTSQERPQDGQRSQEAKRARNKSWRRESAPVYSLNTRERGKSSKHRREEPSDGTEQRRECGYCGWTNHSTVQCRKFIALPLKRKWQWARQKGVCFRCLVSKHRRNHCQVETCKKDGCVDQHHPLLHGKAKPPKVGDSTTTETGQQPSTSGRNSENVTNA